jgi:purine-binding chemotaxis protein CheW
MNVVVRSDEGAVSLLVDQIGDVQEILHDNLEPVPDTLPEDSRAMIRGAYKMQTHLLLILDTERAMNVHTITD